MGRASRDGIDAFGRRDRGCRRALEGHATSHQLVPADIPVFDRPAPDMLARFAFALEAFPAEAVVHIRGDSLFIDPGLIDRLIVAAEAGGNPIGKSAGECDYASYGGRDGRPAMLSPVGIYAEWFRTKALQRAHRAAVDRQERMQVSQYILIAMPINSKFAGFPPPMKIDRDDKPSNSRQRRRLGPCARHHRRHWRRIA